MRRSHYDFPNEAMPHITRKSHEANNALIKNSQATTGLFPWRAITFAASQVIHHKIGKCTYLGGEMAILRI